MRVFQQTAGGRSDKIYININPQFQLKEHSPFRETKQDSTKHLVLDSALHPAPISAPYLKK